MAAQQPAKKLSNTASSSAEGKSEEATFPLITNSLSRRTSNGDKSNNRVPISIPVTSIGINIKDDVPISSKGPNNQQPPTRQLTKTKSKYPTTEIDNSNPKKNPSVSRKVTTGRDTNRKYWAWLEEIEIDALDGLTEDVKERCQVAATARHLAEALEAETSEQTEEESGTNLKRVTSEILTSEKIDILEDRATSEPSVIVHDEGLFEKVKIWHPSGPAKFLKTVLKKDGKHRLINVCFEPKLKSNLSFVPRCYRKHSQAQGRKSIIETKPEPLVPKISIVNMCRQFYGSERTARTGNKAFQTPKK